MRVLLTWELGLNLGHLTRLLPVAVRLKAQGHALLVAVRDMQAAATVLGPNGIAFVHAPYLPQGIALNERATGYADILLSQGWSDKSALWGLTQGWLHLFQLFRPDKLILDYSPTVSLAARIAKIPTILVGNGFELPPLTDPLPPFPGFSWATPDNAAEAEKIATANANSVLSAFKARSMQSLRDLVIEETRLFVTYAELDHYGEREEATYIGPLLGHLNAVSVDWPEGEGPKIFACVRPDSAHVNDILGALTQISARVVCVASGFTVSQLQIYRKKHIRYALRPVNLAPLLDADLCMTYGAEGTLLRFLRAGVPQLIFPWHVETYMATRRIEAAGLGSTLERSQGTQSVVEKIERITGDTRIYSRVKAFAARCTDMTNDNPVEVIIKIVTNGVGTPSRMPASVIVNSVACAAGTP